MTLSSLSENILANLIAMLIIATLTYVIIYLRMSAFSRFIRPIFRPWKRVFALHHIHIDQVVKEQQSSFHSPITNEERGILIRFYRMRNQSRLFNGRSVRLDGLTFHNVQNNEWDNTKEHLVTARISEVDFYDFIATNLTAFPANEPVRSFPQQMAALIRSIRSFTIVQQVMAAVKRNGKPRTVQDVLANRSLANIVAVSVLMIDSTGRLGIVKRSQQVAVSSGHFGATCAGTVSHNDLNAEDPFLSCALREIYEELHITLSELHFDGIVVPKQKMQPILLYHAHLERTWEELFTEIQEARDFSFENQAFYAVPLQQAMPFTAHAHMTDAAAYQVWQYARQNGFQKSWLRCLLTPINKENLLLPWRGCCHNGQVLTIDSLHCKQETKM